MSPTLDVNLKLLVIPYKNIWALQIYNVAIIINYYIIFMETSIIHDKFSLQ